VTALAPFFLLLLAPFAGSFLGTLARRLPAGRPVAFDRSRCAACGRTLDPRDLVPILSWMLARGRCRQCGAAVSWFYPAMELTALGIAGWAVAGLPGWLAWAGAGLGWALLALAVIDARHTLLPDVLTLPLIPVGLLVIWMAEPAQLSHHAIGAVVGFAVFAAIAWAYRRIRGRDGLGLGDAKLLAAGGAWAGWMGLASIVVWASVLALIAALVSGAAVIPDRPGLGLAWDEQAVAKYQI
jgi:leader peptidase (prepilin peptidase)/N-methyltransferase